MSIASSLAPGFRFHPTDEELVSFYLKRKVCGKSFRFDAISEIDVYKFEPWDLPDMSRLKSRDLEWYFFCVLDKKYGNGGRTNRATDRGYWKTTGKDRSVYHRSRTVGMKKTLVYHSGRAPRGERTNWVMHEYRLIDEDLERSGIVQDAFVVCRIFQKSGSGPKNGEHYGAPFVEEEWEEDEVAKDPVQQAEDEVAVSDDAFVELDDLEQNLDTSISPENILLPLNFVNGDSSSYVVNSKVVKEDDPKPFAGSIGEEFDLSKLMDDQQCLNVPEHYELDASTVKDKSSVKINSGDADYLLDEPYFDASDIPPFDEGLFLETNDLSNSVETDPTGRDMIEEYLAYYDADDRYPLYMPSDSNVMSAESTVSDARSLMEMPLDGELVQSSGTSQQFARAQGNDVTVSSNGTSERAIVHSDNKSLFARQATRMLGNIPARPAFAAEFPTKDVSLRLASAAQSPSSVRVNLELSLSFPVHYGDAKSTKKASLLTGKIVSTVSRGWFYLIFFGISILSFNIGAFIYA